MQQLQLVDLSYFFFFGEAQLQNLLITNVDILVVQRENSKDTQYCCNKDNQFHPAIKKHTNSLSTLAHPMHKKMNQYFLTKRNNNAVRIQNVKIMPKIQFPLIDKLQNYFNSLHTKLRNKQIYLCRFNNMTTKLPNLRCLFFIC